MTAPASPTTIVDLAAVKLHLNKTSEADNDELNGVRAAAESMIVENIGPVIPVEVTDDRPGGGGLVALSTPPVLEVLTVTAFAGGVATPVAADDITTGALGWRLDDSRTLLEHTGAGFPAGVVRVAYRAGRAGIPAHIRQAVLDLTAHLWNNSQTGKSRRPDPNVPGGVQRPTAWAMPAAITNALADEMLGPVVG